MIAILTISNEEHSCLRAFALALFSTRRSYLRYSRGFLLISFHPHVASSAIPMEAGLPPPPFSCPLLGFIIFSWNCHHDMYFMYVLSASFTKCVLHEARNFSAAIPPACGMEKIVNEYLWINENRVYDQLQFLEPFS